MLGDVLGTGEVPVDAHFFDDLGADSMLMARFCARVRKRADLPSVSMTRRLPAPDGARPGGARSSRSPSPLEQSFAQVLAEVLGAGEVPVDGHFFDDLGADSMVMARFCARVRKRADLPSVSMKDVYATRRSAAWRRRWRTPRAPRSPDRRPRRPGRCRRLGRGGTARYVLCGTLQFLCFVGVRLRSPPW